MSHGVCFKIVDHFLCESIISNSKYKCDKNEQSSSCGSFQSFYETYICMYVSFV